MKKSNLFIGALFLAVCFSSCKKEEIEIVNQPTVSAIETPSLRSGSTNDTSLDNGGVTDPDDEKDKDLNKRNNTSDGN
ncbi:MAG: hypothetical protein AB8B74_15500 [Crocinitomicaceae bacterium]